MNPYRSLLILALILPGTNAFTQDSVEEIKSFLEKNQGYLRSVTNYYADDRIHAVFYMFKDQFRSHYLVSWDALTYELKGLKRLPTSDVDIYFRTIEGTFQAWHGGGTLTIREIHDPQRVIAEWNAGAVAFNEFANVVAITTSHDSKGKANPTIQLRRLPSLEVIKEFKALKATTHMKMSSSQQFIFTANTDDHSIHMFDIASGKELKMFADKKQKDLQVKDFDITNDASLLATVVGGTTLTVWNIANGQMVHQMETAYELRKVLWHQEGKLLAYVVSDNLIIYDYEKKTEIAKLSNVGYESRIFPTNVGAAIAYQTKENVLAIVDFKTGIPINEFK